MFSERRLVGATDAPFLSSLLVLAPYAREKERLHRLIYASVHDKINVVISSKRTQRFKACYGDKVIEPNAKPGRTYPSNGKPEQK